jgi:hypothetical protein
MIDTLGSDTNGLKKEKIRKPGQHLLDARAEVCQPCYGVLRYPFSSFFNSLTKRQSVPWAMSFCGVLLSIPTSWKRKA